MKPQSILPRRVFVPALAFALSIVGVCTAQTTPPDLTQPGVIAAIKAKTDRPNYIYNYNLGPTGLRGWVHYDGSGSWIGQMTDASRQILVTTASTPGNTVLAVDDVILGAIAADSGTVPSFTSDARKAFGTAISNAEKTGAGTLRLKRWRAGTTSEVNITIPTLGEYSATAPYNCPKSLAILTNTRNQMVGELIANSNYLGSGHNSAINALALLASVKPGDPNYSTVQTRLQTYARSLSGQSLPYQWALGQEPGTWNVAYELVFQSEYYLLTNDSQVVPSINAYTLWLAEFQSMFGTFGHGPGGLLQDASGRRFATGYGPVNAVGNVANLAIVLGKKALLAASQPIDPKIDTAIQRSSGFMGSHINKGCMQYGEHFPAAGSYATNSKEATAALFFGLQNDKTVQTEYFARMSISSWIGGEVGHCGQGWGSLWNALGAGMGGEAAASGHFKQLLWRYDIQRRTDGSFTYDSDTGSNDYYGGTTDDGTYLGKTNDSGVVASSLYLLTYSLPLKRLHITGKDLNTAYNHDLDATKVAHAVSAASYALDRTGQSIAQLFTALGDYDPHLRHFASIELASRSLTATDLTNLRGLLASPDANIRRSAAETLGIRNDATALPTLVGMLNGPNRDPDHWVRQKVADAIRQYDASTVSSHRDALINAFIANAPADPNVIDWADPLQFSQSALSDVLFNQLAAYTINAPKTTHLYPAIRAGLLLPTGYYRSTVAAFARNRMNLTDLQSIFPELVVVASADTPADRMFSAGTRADALAFMVENNISEGVEIAFAMLEGETVFWGSGNFLSVALNALVSYGDAARYTLPRLREVQTFWNTRLWDPGLPHGQLKDTITFLENVTSAPPSTNLGKCVANSQIVTTTGAKVITFTGASPRGAFSFQKLTDPTNGTLTGTAPNLTYTPNGGFTGTDKFTFQTTDSLTTSKPATVAIIVGSSGTGIAGAYFDNADFTSPVLTRSDPQINFDWGTGSPDPSIGPDTFSTRWSGYLLAPETGTYTLSGLTSDGVRAFLNGVPVINNLNDQSTRWTDGQSISLTAGQKVPLLLEYFENTGSAVAKLKWTGPSFAGLNGDIIPQAYLFESNSSGGTDTTAPVISTLSPADNATGVAHATDLVATFSENIVRGTGNITIKNLSDGTQTVIPVTDTVQVAIAGATLILNPTALLPGSKNHAVQIDATAIIDAAGLSFAGINNDTTWNFTTTAPDTTKPTPNPMSFAVPPLTAGSTSITMTATTASDASGVEYRFNNLTLGTSSPWQNSPVLTAIGLLPSNNYTFTVQARDKSAAGNTTTASAPASARTLGSGPLNLMSLNFYAYGSYSQDAVTLEAGESAGLGMFHVAGWQNYEVSWGLDSPAAPITLTSNVGSTATMRLNDVRNGGTYSESPHPLFAGGDGDLMNALCHGTEDPYDQSAQFNMDVSNIPYPSYDLIVYLGANSVHGGDRTGKIVLNGGAERDFTLTLGFSGFTESTNATTPGNYIVFRGLTNPSLNLKVWGNGFNHLGPTGFQIVNYGAITGDTLPPVISTLNPTDEATGVSVGANFVATFSENIAIGTGSITLKNLTDATQTTIPVTDAQVSISGAVLTINPTADLLVSKNYAIQIPATAVKDPANNFFTGITNDTTWNFTTADSVTTPPPVTVGLALHLDATDPGTMTLAGSTVTEWRDKNGSAAKMTFATGTPTVVASGIGGIPTVHFTNGSSMGDGVNHPAPVTVFYVSRQTGGTNQRVLSGGNNWLLGYWGGSRGSAYFEGDVLLGGNGTSDTNPHLYATTIPGSGQNSTVWAEGVQIASNQGGTDGPDGLFLGGGGAYEEYSDCDVSEVLVYHRVLTPVELNQVGFYLAQKYGVSATYVDPGPPVISSLNPADNATGVAVGANLVATFSENVTIGTGNITVKNLTDATQTTIAVTDTTQVSISGAVLTINPTANLAAGKNYAIQIAATAVKDLANNNFAGITNDTTWNFATAVADTTAPTITNRNPADNATGVAVGANLVATFSEPIVSGTGNITIRKLSDSTNTNIAVTDTTQITISGSVLTINPTADLLPNTSYAVRIANTCIDDTAGNGFAGITNNTNWNFSTAAPDTTAPAPNPMTFASPPTAADSSSIAMTATTASDPSGVEYRFNNVTLATSSPWQDSPVYTATGLSSATSYTFTVQARDKSPAQNTTTASASASATTQSTGSLDVMSLNFYSYGSLPPANYHMATLEAGESAGVGVYNVSGWQNYEVPGGLDSPANPFTLTSTLGATATLILNDARNGGADNDQPNPNFGGSGDLMDGLANGTEDPYDESAKFDMTVSNIPYPVYDLIVYLSGNGGVEGDGTGKLILNGGAVQNFTAALPFNGFVEITNATTPGNYIIFRKLRTPSLTLKVWGNGFNHIGPAGFQIVKDTSGVLPPGPASNPNPQDATVGHASNTDLSWTAGLDAVSRNVYLGTNPSPGASELKGNQTATTFDPGTLANGTYYWRIDEVNADGTTTGPVWSFAVGPPAKAFRPMPWNGMKAVATNVGTLKWVAGASATASSNDVYFGTDATPDSSEFMGNQSGTTFNPGPLTPGITYYWRVDEVNAQGTMTGEVWSFTTPGSGSNKVKIFILVGQSNMVGHGDMEPIGTPGTLQYTYNSDPVAYAHLKSGSNWAVRDDAWIWYNRDGTLVKGGHTVGYGADGNNIGPELQFGHAMGIHYGQKVLLIKTAWGGKSLQTDFRPPSAGWDFDVPGKAGDKGFYFTEMLKDVLDATVNLQTHFPAYNPADSFEIAGFAWHQGFNDLISTSASAEYEANMEKFIKDVRLAVGVPNLPFVIATTGQSDPVTYSDVELAQLQMENFAKYPAFNGNVSVVDAKPFWIPVSSSPADEGYHWNRNAKSYYMIGDALAGEMLGLQPDTTAPTPDPMSFATAPNALGQTSITMTATTATDPSGVEYFFECTAGGGHSSAWQDSPIYTDTGLTAATQYSYRVRARDKSAAQTATAWSAPASATTANTPYGTWSGGAAFGGDANHDGVDNGMAWLLGAADPSENVSGKLPKASRNGASLRLEFRCLKSTERDGAILKVQSSSDLGQTDPWTNHEAAVPDADATVNGVVFDTTDDGDYIHVIADIPVSGSGRFARLSAVVTAP
jgi:methionine-rich copper-binding protein CopC